MPGSGVSRFGGRTVREADRLTVPRARWVRFVPVRSSLSGTRLHRRSRLPDVGFLQASPNAPADGTRFCRPNLLARPSQIRKPDLPRSPVLQSHSITHWSIWSSGEKLDRWVRFVIGLWSRWIWTSVRLATAPFFVRTSGGTWPVSSRRSARESGSRLRGASGTTYYDHETCDEKMTRWVRSVTFVITISTIPFRWE
jgi:hypothetical protein